MRWKEYQFFEPAMDGGTYMYPGQLTVPQQLDKIEDEGYEVRSICKEGARYTVLARVRADGKRAG